MLRIVLVTALLLAGGLAFSQETNAGTNIAPAPAPTPVVVVEPKKYPSPIQFSAISRFHYDLTIMSNSSAQKWGDFNFWFLTLKAQAEIVENLKAETSFDLCYFAGQRAISNISTANQLQLERLIETAYMQYKVDTALVLTAGRFWEYYAPWVYSQQTRDGVSLSGSILGGMLKYGFQVFNDPILYSPYMPLMEVMVGVMPLKGINLDLVAFMAGNGETNKKNGYSANLKVVKLEFLPSLVVMNEFALTTTTTTSGITNAYDNFLTIGWQIGTVQPFVELYFKDRNIEATMTNDDDFSARLAAKWDVNPNFAVVPYIMYAFTKNGATAPDPLSFRLRLDVKF
jgi:hypothetical protein